MKLGEVLGKRTKAAIEFIYASEIGMGYQIKISTSDQRGTWVFNSSWDPGEDEEYSCYLVDDLSNPPADI